jgi:16S rRNA G527 N7-methylase RsmG
MFEEPETAAPDWRAFSEAAGGFGAPLSSEQVAAFAEYLRLLREWNQKFNLTAISPSLRRSSPSIFWIP